MSKKKYVPAGAFMLCDKCVAPVPMPLTVTSNLTVQVPGGLLATDFDELPVLNIPPFGVCGITHGPCTYAPLPPGWTPVQDSVAVGPQGGHPLLEDSKMRCAVGGQISLYLTMGAAIATLPDIVSQGFDATYAALEGVKNPLGDLLRLDVGMAKGVWQGAYGLASGLVSLAKLGAELQTKAVMAVGGALVDTVVDPVGTAQRAAAATSAAAHAGWTAVSDGDNWLAAGELASYAVPGVLVAKGTEWISHEENQAKVGAAYDKAKAWEAQLTDFERSTLVGRIGFEVALFVGTLGSGEAVNAAAKTGEVVEVARALEVGGEAATGGVRLLGEVTTGAEDAARAAEAAPSTFEELFAGVKECFTEGHPVDVATGLLFTQATDFTLPGPLPLAWTRTWFSTSTHQGALGHGWHHDYDLGLTPAPDGGATLRRADGRRVVFAAPAPGARSFNRRHKLELAHGEAGDLRVWDLAQRCWYVFEATGPAGAPAGPAPEQRLRAVEDANGFRIGFAYTLAGHLASLTDSAGRVLPCETDAAGRLLALHAPDPAQPGATFALVRYTYDAAGDLVAATDALGHAARFTYQGHLMTRETFRSGLNFYFEYDGAGPTARCVHTWGDGGIYDTKLRYHDAGHTTVWDSYGHQKEYYHQRGLVTHRVDALGATQRWDYNQYAELERATDPLGHATRHDYNARGHVTATTYPDGAKVATAFDAQGRPAAGTDANGGAWQWAYDAQGRLGSSTNPAGAVTRYAYDARGRLAELTNALGHVTRLRHDEQGNLVHTVAPDGSIRSQEYDALGQVVKLTDATGHVQHRRYDRLGQLTGLQLPDGSFQHFAYDAEGNVVRTHDGHQTVEFVHSPIGQVVQRRQGGQQVQFTYDREGNLTGLRNEQDDAYRFGLDAAGRVVEEVGFDGLTRRYVRDAAGRVTRVERPAGRATAYAYDAAGRVTEVLHNETERTCYRYRADGALLEAANHAATVRVERDPMGRLLAETQDGHTVRSRYDARGQRLGLTSSLGADVGFERDALGQVQRTHAGAWESRVERDAEGLELHRQLSGGLRTGWQRDALGRPTSQRITVAGGTGRQRRHQWQGADHLVEIDDSLAGRTRFAFDEWDNLAAVTYPDGTEDLRQPDAVGNLFRTQPRTDRRYGKGGQLREANGTRYRYDEEGNLTQKTLPDGRMWRYAWDGAGQLASVTRPDGYAVTFAYDALGRRLSKRFRGRVTRWVWDGDKPLHEWTELEVGPGAGAAADLATWLFEEDSFAPAAKLTAKENYSVVCDHLGTPLAMYDGRGAPAWEMALDAYGGVRQGKGNSKDCPFRYQGQYEDAETGLYYNRFRYYDPETGNYISQDPIGVLGGHRLYAYVDNPLARVDVFGLTPCKPGTATVQWSPPEAGAPGRFGHFSVEVNPVRGGGPGMHTHQVIMEEDLSSTTISRLNGGLRQDATKSVKIGITNAENAVKFQTESLGKELGPYGKNNNCVDHVCEVLRQGGETIPKSITGQLGYLRELGIF